MSGATVRRIPEGMSGGPRRVERCPFCDATFPIYDLKDETVFASHMGNVHKQKLPKNESRP